jgi:hypothetical protein
MRNPADLRGVGRQQAEFGRPQFSAHEAPGIAKFHGAFHAFKRGDMQFPGTALFHDFAEISFMDSPARHDDDPVSSLAHECSDQFQPFEHAALLSGSENAIDAHGR